MKSSVPSLRREGDFKLYSFVVKTDALALDHHALQRTCKSYNDGQCPSNHRKETRNGIRPLTSQVDKTLQHITIDFSNHLSYVMINGATVLMHIRPFAMSGSVASDTMHWI